MTELSVLSDVSKFIDEQGIEWFDAQIIFNKTKLPGDLNTQILARVDDSDKQFKYGRWYVNREGFSALVMADISPETKSFRKAILNTTVSNSIHNPYLNCTKLQLLEQALESEKARIKAEDESKQKSITINEQAHAINNLSYKLLDYESQDLIAVKDGPSWLREYFDYSKSKQTFDGDGKLVESVWSSIGKALSKMGGNSSEGFIEGKDWKRNNGNKHPGQYSMRMYNRLRNIIDNKTYRGEYAFLSKWLKEKFK